MFNVHGDVLICVLCVCIRICCSISFFEGDCELITWYILWWWFFVSVPTIIFNVTPSESIILMCSHTRCTHTFYTWNEFGNKKKKIDYFLCIQWNVLFFSVQFVIIEQDRNWVVPLKKCWKLWHRLPNGWAQATHALIRVCMRSSTRNIVVDLLPFCIREAAVHVWGTLFTSLIS